MGLDRVGSPPGVTVLATVTGRGRRDPAGPYGHAARRRPSSRWRVIAGSRYECIDVAPHLMIYGVPPARRVGGPEECDCLPALPPVRLPARASALARTTSGSRGSGGRTSCHGRSRRALGRWIRICCTVSHLPWSATYPRGPMATSPAPLARLFWERYEGRPPWGVTQKCLPGGMSRRGDPSPEGATRGRCGTGERGTPFPSAGCRRCGH